MKMLSAIGLASIIVLAASAPADARQGCGGGFHRARNGMCVPNRGRHRVYVVGRYYAGRGYWYDNRWWHHRMRWHRGWRYR